MNKELLREFAYDLLDLLEENEKLQEENKELRKYKKQRTKEFDENRTYPMQKIEQKLYFKRY